MDEILAQVFAADQLGRTVIVLGELAHTGPVALLAAGLEWQQSQIIGEAFQDCVRGTFFICMTTILTMVGGLPCDVARRTVSSLWESESKANAKPRRQRPKCEAEAAPFPPPRSGFVQQTKKCRERGGEIIEGVGMRKRL